MKVSDECLTNNRTAKSLSKAGTLWCLRHPCLHPKKSRQKFSQICLRSSKKLYVTYSSLPQSEISELSLKIPQDDKEKKLKARIGDVWHMFAGDLVQPVEPVIHLIWPPSLDRLLVLFDIVSSSNRSKQRRSRPNNESKSRRFTEH